MLRNKNNKASQKNLISFFPCNVNWSLIFRQGKTLKVKVKVVQLCPTLCNPIDYTLHGILQARILDWIAFLLSRGSSQPRDWTQVSHNAGRFFTQLSHKGTPRILEWVAYPFSRGSSWHRNWTGVSYIAGGLFTSLATREAPIHPRSS